MIVKMNGGYTIKLADEPGLLGHLVIDMGRLLHVVPSEPVRIYMESPIKGTKPLVTIVPLDEDGKSDHDRMVRKQFAKAEILEVST